jgi:membrane protein DedA with SNARE-associated domain
MTARFRVARAALLALVVLAAVATAVSAVRTYRSFILLRAAYETGVPDLAGIRAWMTLRFVAQTYGAPEGALVTALGLPADTDPNASLRSLAEHRGTGAFEYVQRAQRALADVAPATRAEAASEPAGVVEGVGDRLLAAVLAYGYPVLALLLLLGALGLPVPTALAVTLAGSLAARDELSWAWVGMLAVTASVIGDAAGYALGRYVGTAVLERHGRWIGYTPGTHAHVLALFERWGAATVFLSRTLASHLSAVLNLLAGAGRYRVAGFLLFTIAGRIVWVAAYLALGLAVGTSLEAASGFLANASIFVFSAAIVVISALAAFRPVSAGAAGAPP